MDAAEKKRLAATAALEFIEPGVRLGVGTGSTVNFLIDMLVEKRDLIDCVVSSSRASTTLLEERGFDVRTLNQVPDLDLYIDGADETDKHLQLIKGGGLFAEITPIADQSNTNGDVIALQATATDPNGDTIAFSASGLPVGVDIDETTGVISGTIDFPGATATTLTTTITAADTAGQRGEISFFRTP